MPRIQKPPALSTETTKWKGHKGAHKVLRQLRDEMCTRGNIIEEARDLTDGKVFDWKAYLASRLDREFVIGQGIARVEARFLSSRDPNHATLKVSNRFDFLFHRIDGSVARVHPEEKQHGHVTEHRHISECVNWGTRADDILPLVGIPPADAFDPTAVSRGMTIPQVDTVSAKQAWAWLGDHVDMTGEAVQPPETAPAASQGVYVNWIDLWDAKKFRWHQFWTGRHCWGPPTNICAFGPARWLGDGGDKPKPCFVAGMRDGSAVLVSFCVRRGGQADKDTVKAIRKYVVVEPAAGPPAAPAAPRGFEPEVGQDGAPPPPPPGIGPQTRQPPPPPPPPRRAQPNGGGVAADADPGATPDYN